jgi:hypothetical protein
MKLRNEPWRAPAAQHGLTAGAILLAITAGLSCGDLRNEQPPDATAGDAGLPPGSAHVSVIRAGVQQDYDWTNASGSYIACGSDGDRSYFIRLARSAAHQGQDVDHVDLDVCNFDGPGSFPMHDPFVTGCDPVQKSFDVWWHASDGAFANNAASAPCTLAITGDAAQLTIAVSCDDLVRPIASPDRVAVRAEAHCLRGP